MKLISTADAIQEQRKVLVPFAWPPLASMVAQVIGTLVEPRSWKVIGGSGEIQYAGGKSFQVTQSQHVFRQFNQLLTDLSGS